MFDIINHTKDSFFYDISTIKTKLSNTIPKEDWGMIWCK